MGSYFRQLFSHEKRMTVVFHFTVIELDDSIRHVIVAIIMADNYHELPARFQFRQKLVVESLLELRILIGGPLVKDVDRSILHVGCQQCETLSLAGGQVDR